MTCNRKRAIKDQFISTQCRLSEFTTHDRSVSHTQDQECTKALHYYNKNQKPSHFQRRVLGYRHSDLVGFNNKGTIYEYGELSIQSVDLDKVSLHNQYFYIVL
jgi:hypothetical protein